MPPNTSVINERRKKRRRIPMFLYSLLAASFILIGVSVITEAGTNRPLRYYTDDNGTALTYYTQLGGDTNISGWGINTDDPTCEFNIGAGVCINGSGSLNQGFFINGTSISGGGASTGNAYVTVGNVAELTAERAVASGAGVTITDGGANGALTFAVDAATCSSGNYSVFNGTGFNCTNDASGGGGSGTVTSLTEGIGINLTPDTITTTGSIALANLVACNPVTEYSVWNGSHWSCDNDGDTTDTNYYSTAMDIYHNGTVWNLSMSRNTLTNLSITWPDIDTDTDTWNTTEEMIAAANSSGLLINWTFVDTDTDTDTVWGRNDSDIINQSGNLALNRTTLDAEYVGQNEYPNLDTDSTNDLTSSNIVAAVGNWSLDQSSYTTTTAGDSRWGNQSFNVTCSDGFFPQSFAFNKDGTANATSCIADQTGGGGYDLNITVNGGSDITITDSEKLNFLDTGIVTVTTSGNDVTIDATEQDGDSSNELQNVWYNISGDTGYTVADILTDNLQINGSTNGIDTAVGDNHINISLDLSEVAADAISESQISFSTSCAAGNHLYISGGDLSCEQEQTAGYGLLLSSFVFSVNAGALNDSHTHALDNLTGIGNLDLDSTDDALPGNCVGQNSTHINVTQNTTTSGVQCVAVAINPGGGGAGDGDTIRNITSFTIIPTDILQLNYTQTGTNSYNISLAAYEESADITVVQNGLSSLVSNFTGNETLFNTSITNAQVGINTLNTTKGNASLSIANTNWFSYITSGTIITGTAHIQYMNTTAIVMNASQNITSTNIVVRYFSANSCKEISNSSGVYIVC